MESFNRKENTLSLEEERQKDLEELKRLAIEMNELEIRRKLLEKKIEEKEDPKKINLNE